MNQFVEKMKEHVSVRDFEPTLLDEATKKDLISAAQSGSSSDFVQAFSIIEVSDEKLRQELGKLAHCESYVSQTGVFYVFVADLYRQSTMLTATGASLDGLKNSEALLIATVDTTIAAQNMAVAAEMMGLGVCYIGGIRNDIQRVAELLHLPAFTVPLYGMTIGKSRSKNQVKPRLPRKNQVSQNYYDQKLLTELSDYDDIVKNYYVTRQTNAQEITWSAKNVDFWNHVRRPNVAAFLKKQGFKLD